MNKALIIVISVLIAGAIAGGYFYPKFTGLGTSTAGATFNTPKFYGAAMNLANAGANGTSTSMLNSDANDRYVTGVVVACEGVGTSQTAYTGTGLAALKVNIGTTTTANPSSFVSFAAVTGSGLTVATGTVDMLIASSTPVTATSTLAMVWPSNTYMTFAWNATNTAACTVGVNTVGS